MLTTWCLKRPSLLLSPDCSLCVFQEALSAWRKTERAPRTVALQDQRLQDRIKWFPLLHWELLLPLCKTPAPSQDYYFWQCLPQEGTFADLMGRGPLYTAFCMALCHHFHRGQREGGEKNWGMLSKVNSKQDCLIYVILNTVNIYFKHQTLSLSEVEMNWVLICM